MLRYQSLCRRPRVIASLTGLSLPTFQQLLEHFEPLWRQAEVRRLTRSRRRHAIGGGRPYRLKHAADKLLLFLTLCRHGLTYELAGALFGLDLSNVRRLFLRLVPVVEAAADPQLAHFLDDACRQRHAAGRGSVGNWQALLQRCPELAEVAVDCTEQPCRRPSRKRDRRRYYSGKRKRHTLKVQVVVARHGRIVEVSGSYPGREHDKRVYEHERLHERLPPRTRQFVDLAYVGLEREHPESDLRLPYKRKGTGCRGRGRRGAQLTRGQKQANGLRRRRRVVAEHRLAAVKGYRLLAEAWRSRPQRHNGVFRAITAVTNFRLARSTPPACASAA